MHIPTFKLSIIKQVWLLIQQGDYTFSIDLKHAYLHIPISKCHHHLLWFVWQHKPYRWKVLPVGLATAPGVFTLLTKPILFLCCHKRLCVIIYLDYTLVLIPQNMLARELKLSCALF